MKIADVRGSLQAIVNHPDWDSGDAATLVLNLYSNVTFASYDHPTYGAPKLTVTFDPP